MNARRAELIAEHLDDLRRSGLSDDTIVAMHVRSLSAAELAASLGYTPSGVQSALVLPYPELDFTRYKLFPPAVDASGHSMRYAQREGSGVHLYILPGVRTVLTDATVPVYWAEGEKKTARAAQDGLACIGLGGLWNWIEAGTAEGIAELDAIVHVEREEIIIPDSDVWTRPDLLQAVYAFGRELEARGAKVGVVIIPSADGAKVGLDDFLVARGAGAFRELKPISLKHAGFTKQREWYPSWKESRTPKQPANGAAQGTALTLSDPEPWPVPVDGAELLDAISAVLTRYVVLPTGAAVAAALWVLHTYLIGVLGISPLVTATSPQKRCGKSTLLDVLRGLCRRALAASNISAAALFRVVEMLAPTLLIDEADTFFTEREELRGILDAGHTRSTAQVVRTVGDDHEPRVFCTFCAKAIAAIGDLPGTIEDRAISIHMKRRAPGEHVERLRRDRIDGEFEPLRRRAARWAADNANLIRDADPDVPTELNDRAADNWRPLLAIADAAAGAWPTRAREAALILSGAAVTEDSDVKVQLLADLRELFSKRGNDRLASETIVEHLTKLEGRPWAEWRRGKPLTKTGLARLLKPFDVRPKQVWVSGSNVHGYERTDFADAWARYLPAAAEGFEPLETLEPAPDKAETPFSQPLGDGAPSTLKNAGNPCAAGILAGLADESGEVEEGTVP